TTGSTVLWRRPRITRKASTSSYPDRGFAHGLHRRSRSTPFAGGGRSAGAGGTVVAGRPAGARPGVAGGHDSEEGGAVILWVLRDPPMGRWAALGPAGDSRRRFVAVTWLRMRRCLPSDPPGGSSWRHWPFSRDDSFERGDRCN